MLESGIPHYRQARLPAVQFEGLLNLRSSLKANREEIMDGLVGITKRDLVTLRRNNQAMFEEVRLLAKELNFSLPKLTTRKIPNTPTIKY